MSRKQTVSIVLEGEQKKLFNQLTTLQKRFVRELIKGKGKADAYKAAGSKATNHDSLRAGASQILTNINIKAFKESIRPNLESLDQEELNTAVMDRQEAQEILTDIGRTSMSDLVTYQTCQIGEDENGNPVKQSVWQFKDSALNDPKKMASINELTAGPTGLKIKIENRTKGIEGLRKMNGWDEPDKHEISGDLSLNESDLYDPE